MDLEEKLHELEKFKQEVEHLGNVPNEKIYNFHNVTFIPEAPPFPCYYHIYSLKFFLNWNFSLVKCPVCDLIPRKLPINCCANGHIICSECRPSVMFCPLCRSSLFSNYTNTVAGSLAELCSHACRYAVFGCKTTLKMDEIVEHETSCEERTVSCPYPTCREEIQLKFFVPHVLTKSCALD